MEARALEMEELAKKLVKIPSINSTEGERQIGEFIEQYLRSLPYFQQHPNQIIIQELPGDELKRRNVFAYVKGKKKNNGETMLLHGHMDTVGTLDYGMLQPFAHQPEQLLEKMLQMDLPEGVRKDLSSGDWMVGRGACDMKSGVAVFLVLIKEWSERTEELAGNLLLSVNPVEENLHTGIIEGIKILEELQEKEGFHYVLAINNDYICPLYEGDSKRYVYTGTVGKLLPCFYIQGKETHVGQCFEGFDASRIAAELVRAMHLNTEFCDGYEGEYTLPPSVLKMKDLKPWYNVQTSFDAFVYFNYFVHNASIEEILEKLQNTAKEVLVKVEKALNKEYKRYCELTNTNYEEITYHMSVMTYEELYKKAIEAFGGELQKELEEYTEELLKEKTDQREIPMFLVKRILKKLQWKNPVIVIFFAPPYCPHNTLKVDNENEKKCYLKLKEIINDFEKDAGEEFEILQFFPSLSDSSYIKIDDDDESIYHLIQNFPEYSHLYPLPLSKIKKLNIPAVNYGCYGKDAHKWTERVYKPYTFETLPQLINKTIETWL